MIKIKLTRLNKPAESLRTPFVIGMCEKLPSIGEPFLLLSKPIEEGCDVRMVGTTPVSSKFDESPTGCKFYTESNSLYQLEIL